MYHISWYTCDICIYYYRVDWTIIKLVDDLGNRIRDNGAIYHQLEDQDVVNIYQTMNGG